MGKLKTNPDDPNFIEAVKNLNEGETIEVVDGTLEVEGKFAQPTHFTFHQRIFPAGMILKKRDSNTRIFIEAEKLGMKVESTEINDRQITEDGTILPADEGTQAKE